MAGSDLVIEVHEVRAATEIPEQRITARLARLEQHGTHSVLHLRTPRSQTLQFLAGQSVDLGLGDLVRRAAVASCPCNGMQLEFHLRRDDSDPFVCAAQRLRPGDALTVVGPRGDVLLDESHIRPLVLVAEESGFAPIKSLLEHAISLEWPAPIHLLWLAETGGHYLENYVRALVDALDDLHFRALPCDLETLVEALEKAASGADIYAAVAPPTLVRLQAFAEQRGARLFRDT